MVCTPVLAKLLVDYVCKLRPKEEAMWWANEECFLDLCMAQAREEPLADVLIKHSIIPRNLLLADGASVQMQGPEGRKKSEKSYFRRWKDASWQNRGWEEAKKVYSVGSPLQGDASKVVLQGDSVLVVNGLRGELKPAHIVDTKASEGLPFSAPALHTLIQFDSSKKVYAVLTETIQDSCTPLAGEGGLRRSRRTTAKKVECQKILSPNVVPTVAIMSKGPGNLPPLYFNVFFTNVVFKSVRLNQDHTVTLQEYRSGWEVEVSPSYLQEVLLAPRSFMKEMEASVGQFLRLPVSSRPNNVAASIPSDVTAEESSKVEAVISVKSKETTAGQQEGLLHPTKAQSVQVRSTTSFSGGHTPWSSVDVEFQQNQHEWHCVKDSLANTFWVHGKMTEDVKIQEFAKKGVFELDIPNDAAVGGMTIHKVNAGIQKSLGLRLVKLDHETFNPLHGATWKRTVKEGDASEPLPLFVVVEPFSVDFHSAMGLRSCPRSARRKGRESHLFVPLLQWLKMVAQEMLHFQFDWKWHHDIALCLRGRQVGAK
ncbi:expressed unknown protein [Seminavis robusta]|uniref:Uncharacterized protein n=1 Tax=Seminavis robusta TaxID=568900 RepID=A0A9N8ERF2_9STRA|nr:expressed unknown protein [Seminavis robusta]|eukprot:Sro1672_g290170.1 n/a (539) ;mRNA; r:16839-18901